MEFIRPSTNEKINTQLEKWKEEINRNFIKEAEMARKHMKSCSRSIVIKKMQVKTTMRYHFIATKLATITKSGSAES